MNRLWARSRTFALAFVCTACVAAAGAPTAAAASNPIGKVCDVAGLFNGLIGKACSAAQNGGRLADAAKKLLTGHVGAAVKSVLGGSSTASSATAKLGFAAIATWVFGGAKVALHETVSVLGKTTTPQLRSTWFSSTYWRMAAIAAVLTVPFLFAAAIQAVMRADLALLVRAAFGYLPLSMLAIAVAAPVTMLLLAASDELSAAVSSGAGNSGAHYLGNASDIIGGLTVIAGSSFLAFLIGVLIVAGALTLWIELLMREAAVYVIVLMLPLVFAAFVWPARRIWAIRAVELLVALILSKFAIVAVLSLGGAALSNGLSNGITGWIAGVVLLFMGAFVPWALLRLVPMSELAASAVGPLRGELRASDAAVVSAQGYAGAAEDWAASKTAEMRNDANDTAATPRPADPAGLADLAPGGAEPANLTPGGGEAAGLAREDAEPADLAPDATQPADPAPTESSATPGARDAAPGSSTSPSGADGGPPRQPAHTRQDAHPEAPNPQSDVDADRLLPAEDELPQEVLGLDAFPPKFEDLRRRLGISADDGQDPDRAPERPDPTPPHPDREEGPL